MWAGIIQSIEGLTRAKWQRKAKFALYVSWDNHLLCPQTLASLVVRAFVFGLETPSLLGLQLAGSSCGTSQTL